MTSVKFIGSAVSRRSVLRGLSAAAAYPVFRAGAATQEPMHTTVANRARELANGAPLELRLLLPNGSAGNVTPVVEAFLKMTGIDVALFETPVDEINTELSLDALSETQKYDVALPATYGIPGLVDLGAILPITQFAERYEPPEFRKGILYGVGDSFDGELYGFQTDGDAYLMFYNKRMLEDHDERSRYEDRFGQELFKPETWAELDRQMAFFNRPDDGQWGGLLFRTPDYLASEWWVRFHAKGFWPFSRDMEPQIASEAGVEVIEEMIRATESLHPDTARLGVFDNMKRYTHGDIYCNIGWGGSQKRFNAVNSKMRGNMLFGPTPGGMVNGKLLSTPYFNWGWDYVVSSSSQHPEISYLFALFASTPEMSTIAVRQSDGFFDPFRPEHYDDAGIQAAYSTEFLDIHRASLEASIPDLYLKNQGEYFRVLGAWLLRALSGETTPQRALERVALRWRLITNGSGRTKQRKRWTELREKYPQQVRDTLR